MALGIWPCSLVPCHWDNCLLSPDLNTEIHFWAFFQALLSLSPKWSMYLIVVCLRAQLPNRKQLYKTRYEINFEKWVLYKMKRNSTLFDKTVWSCYSCFIHSKEFFSNPWRNDTDVCSLLWVGFSQKFGLGYKPCSKSKTGQEPVSCIWKWEVTLGDRSLCPTTKISPVSESSMDVGSFFQDNNMQASMVSKARLKSCKVSGLWEQK